MIGTMPADKNPRFPFGARLREIRKARGLSQVELAARIRSSQRALSYYEVVAAYPPAEVIVELAKALGVSTDELLGVKRHKEEGKAQAEQRLWRKFRQVRALPEKDQRAIARMISSLLAVKGNGDAVERVPGLEAVPSR